MDKPRRVKNLLISARKSSYGDNARQRMIDPIPTLAQARKRLAAAKHGAEPWLTPAGLDALRDCPEILGPKIFRKP